MVLVEQYKTEKKDVKRLICGSKKKYYRNQLTENKGNSSGTWKIIKDIVPQIKKKKVSWKIQKIKLRNLTIFFANVGKKTFDETQKLTTPVTYNPHHQQYRNHKMYGKFQTKTC